jgi:Ca2+/H+ antiporter, TMEM165/GDT1 family
MKFRRRPSPLLLLIPSLSFILVSASPEGASSDLSKNREAREANVLSATATIPIAQLSLKPTSKVDVGTKDAPVDGKDGKPHAGPFVDYEKDRKKQTTATEDGELATKKPTTLKEAADEKFTDGRPIPEVNDGVMNDPSRELPRQGTTGTEGGVSEKDKARKAQEGQTGEKLEKKPDSPKEAPPLPHSEQEKINKGEKDVAKQAEKDASKKNKGKDSDVDDASELLGLEVCQQILPNSLFCSDIVHRNQVIYQRRHMTYRTLCRTLPTRIIWRFPNPIQRQAHLHQS